MAWPIRVCGFRCFGSCWRFFLAWVGRIKMAPSMLVERKRRQARPHGRSSRAAWQRLVRGVYETLQRLVSHQSDMTVFQNHEDAQEFVARGVVPRRKALVIAGSGVRTDLLDPARVSLAQRREARAS